jgi:hypothetical protein
VSRFQQKPQTTCEGQRNLRSAQPHAPSCRAHRPAELPQQQTRKPRRLRAESSGGPSEPRAPSRAPNKNATPTPNRAREPQPPTAPPSPQPLPETRQLATAPRSPTGACNQKKTAPGSWLQQPGLPFSEFRRAHQNPEACSKLGLASPRASNGNRPWRTALAL